jgi:pimeloyl-ACP methyl ester carboxylesterase
MSPLPPALSGERIEFTSAGAEVSAYVAGHGPPMLLIHSVNAAASAAEVRPVYEHYRQSRTVLALDLPGFGFSQRSQRPYTPQLMTQAVIDALEWLRERCGDTPVDALGLSLSCEYLARAALQAPLRLCSLSLVRPPWF